LIDSFEEGDDLAQGHKVTVTVVVSGAPQTVTVGHNQKVEHLIKEALKEAGIHHPKLEEWTLRFAKDGAVIDPAAQVDDAGITDGMTLFLDPDEGGGGQIAVTFEAPAVEPPPILVDPSVSASKLSRQLGDWEAEADTYRDRGWFLLGRGELHVDVGFACHLPVGPYNEIAGMPLGIRFGFENYDVWAPSVTVIDPISARPLGTPRLGALEYKGKEESQVAVNVFVGPHPKTGTVFLCKRGVREYHSHPEHDGDDWLLHRGHGYGTLVGLCNMIWRLTTRIVTGLNFVAKRIEIGGQKLGEGFGVEITQENVDAIAHQVGTQTMTPGQETTVIQAAPGQVPAEVLAQLPPQLQVLFGGAAPQGQG
jgi:hypothetical protein